MTATAMPLAWVRAIIVPTSASMAVLLGKPCAAFGMDGQMAAKNAAKSGKAVFRSFMEESFQNPTATYDFSTASLLSWPAWTTQPDARDVPCLPVSAVVMESIVACQVTNFESAGLWEYRVSTKRQTIFAAENHGRAEGDV